MIFRMENYLYYLVWNGVQDGVDIIGASWGCGIEHKESANYNRMKRSVLHRNAAECGVETTLPHLPHAEDGEVLAVSRAEEESLFRRLPVVLSRFLALVRCMFKRPPHALLCGGGRRRDGEHAGHSEKKNEERENDTHTLNIHQKGEKAA